MALLVLCEECAGPGTPEELFEAIEDVLLEFCSFEVPDSIAVFDLMIVTLRLIMDEQPCALTVCLQALALVAKYLPLGSHSASVTA